MSEELKKDSLLSEEELRTVAGGADDDYGTHVVQPGETLYQIAARYCTSVSKLQAINGLHNNCAVKPGTRIKVPKR